MKRGIDVPFEPKAVVGVQDRIVFEKAWKNGRWHAYEPDIPGYGRHRRHHGQGAHGGAVISRPSPTGRASRIDLHFLLGRPQNSALIGAYETAKEILAHAPFATEVVDENDINDFVASIESACRAH